VNQNRAGGELVAEIAAVEEMDAKRVEVAGSGHVEFNDGGEIESFFANGLEAVAAMTAGEGKRAGDSSTGNTGDGGDAALRFGEELYGASGV
jgi:hypothetical protein